ncbi:MAG: efflux RND transporter periplasmic adaptor subunit [Polyangiaceae bacterium]
MREASEGGRHLELATEQVATSSRRVTALERAARANLAESSRRRGETYLRAPFAGVVTDVLVQAGEFVQPSQPVLRIAGQAGHEVILQVPAELADALREGTAVSLAAVGLEERDPLARQAMTGRIRAVVADSTGLDGFFPVAIDISPNAALRAGIGVDVRLPEPTRTAIQVPLGAILDPSGYKPFVWKEVGGHAERAWVRLGALVGDQVEILEGLHDGDRIVVRGHTQLLPGDDVGGGS